MYTVYINLVCPEYDFIRQLPCKWVDLIRMLSHYENESGFKKYIFNYIQSSFLAFSLNLFSNFV